MALTQFSLSQGPHILIISPNKPCKGFCVLLSQPHQPVLFATNYRNEAPIIHFQRRWHPSLTPAECGRSPNMQCSLQGHLYTLLPVCVLRLAARVQDFNHTFMRIPGYSRCCGVLPDLPSGLRPSFPLSLSENCSKAAEETYLTHRSHPFPWAICIHDWSIQR